MANAQGTDSESLTDDSGESGEVKHKVTRHTVEANCEQELKGASSSISVTVAHSRARQSVHTGVCSRTFWSPPALKALSKEKT